MWTKNEVWSSKNDDTMMGTRANGMTYSRLYLNLTNRNTAMTNIVMSVMRNTMRRRLANTFLRSNLMKK